MTNAEVQSMGNERKKTEKGVVKEKVTEKDRQEEAAGVGGWG